jgi:hypothetical protein
MVRQHPDHRAEMDSPPATDEKGFSRDEHMGSFPPDIDAGSEPTKPNGSWTQRDPIESTTGVYTPDED